MSDNAEQVPGDDSRQARTYLDIVGFMVVAIDADQKVSFVNGRCCEFLGYSSKEDILGKRWFDAFLPDETREDARAAFADLMAGRTETVPGCELPVLTRHGQEKVISWHQVVLRDERGRIVGVLGSGEDVTERKLAERMVSRLTDDLAERVKELKCLYSVSNTVQGHEASEEERLQNVVNLLPSGWHHPENTCARLTIGDRVFATENFRDTAWKLTSGITAHEEPIGALEVCLLELRTDGNERPQLAEEEDLIKAVAEQIGKTIEVEQAKRALQDSERKYRKLVENLHEGIWAIDGDACTSFVSSRMADMLGYSPEEMLGRHLFSFMDEASVDLCTSLLQRRRQGIREQHEFRFLKKDGTPLYAILATSPVTDADGNYAGAVAGVLDITDRRRIEEELREAELLYRTLVSSASKAGEAIGILQDGDGREAVVIFANEEMERLTGYGRDELIGLALQDVLAPGERDVVGDRYRKRQQGEEVPRYYETRITRKDGREIPIELSAGIATYRGSIATIVYTRDISERKRVEEALRETEQRYCLLADNVEDGVWVTDLNLHPTYVSPSARHVFGYASEEILAKPIHEMMTPESLEQAMEVFEAQLAAEKGGQSDRFRSWSMEIEFIRKDGSIVCVEEKATFLRDSEGSPVGLLGVARDITERKLGEEALRQSEERYRDLVERISDVIYAVDDHGVITYVSPAVESRSGYSQSQLVGRCSTEFIHEEDVKVAAGVLRSGLSGRAREFELRVRSASGDIRWLRGSSLPTYDGDRIVGLQGVLTDITDRKVAEQELWIKDSAIASSINGIAMCDLEGKLTYVNPSFMRLWGYDDDEEVLGRPATEFWWYPEEADLVLRSVIDRGQWQGELIALRKDGSTFHVELSSSIVADAHGRPGCVLASFVDITERKQVEEALRRSEAKYRELVENISDVIYEVDNKCVVTYVSPVIQSSLGYSPEEMTGRPFAEFCYWEDVERALGAVERVLSDHSEENEYRVVSKSGEIRWMHTSSQPTFVGGRVGGLRGVLSDVTERRRVQEALSESERRYRLLIDNLEDGIWMTDMDMNLTYVSPAAERIRGYRAGEAQLQPISDMLTPESFERAMKTFEEQMAVEGKGQAEPARSWTLELEAIHRNGSTVWLEQKVTFMRDQKGKPVGMLGVVRDITERKRADEVLRKSERRYRLLADNVGDGIWTTDLDLNVTYVSPSAKRLRGYGADEEFNQPLDKMLTPESFQLAIALFEHELGNISSEPGALPRSWTLELEALRKDGSTFWVEEIVTLLRDRDGRPAGLLGVTRDINERKQVEDALRESERRYRLVADNVTDVIWTANMDLDITYMSPSVQRLTGDTIEEALAKRVDEFMTPDSLSCGMQVLEEQMALEESGQADPSRCWSVEVKLICKDGSTTWVEEKVSFLRDTEGRPVGLLGVTRDITERKRAEEALRESEDRFRTIYERSPIGIALYDSEGRWAQMNQACMEIFGVTDVEQSRTVSIFNDPNMSELAKRRLRAGKIVRHEGAFDFDQGEQLGFYSTGKSGLVYLYVLITPLGMRQDGSSGGFVLHVQDVTERTQTEEALRASENKYRVLFETTLDGALVVDRERMQIALANQAAARMYGFDSAEDLASMSPLDLVPTQDRDLVSRLFAEELFEKDLQKVTRFRGQTRDGREIWISAIGMRTEYEGRAAGLVSFRDVTDVKSAEEKMQELYEQERRLRRKLESEIKRRIEFTRALAHELKTPLTAVLASSSALVANLPEGTALDFARNLERGAHHLNSRIDELLDTAKGEVGLLYLSGRPVDPVDLLRDMADEMALVFSSRRQSLGMELPSHLPMIWADEGRLRQVLFNLLSNACKYTPEGGKITIKARRKDADLVVEVKDTGTGIARKEQRKLFEPYQPREIDGKPTGGLGLGLALSKTLVELHGGQIWMRSRKGKGSTFAFSVPLANAGQISFRMWRPEVEMASSRLTKTGRSPKPDSKRPG